MRLTNQQKIIGAILLIAIAAVIILGRGQFSGLVGFSTLSLTQGTSYISSDPFYNEPSYTLAIVVDGSSGSAKGTITPDMIAEFTGDKKPSGPFDIQVDVLNESCKYTLLNQSSLVYSYATQSGAAGPGQSVCYFNPRPPGLAYCTATTSSGSVYGTTTYFDWATKNVDGEVFLLDSVAQYDSKIRVRLITQNETQEIYLGPLNKNAEIPNVLRASIVGALMGTQSCPQPAIDTVIYRAAGTTQLQPKNRVLYNTVYSDSFVNPTLNSQATPINNNLNNFKSSTAPSSSYCDLVSVNGITTQYVCRPFSPVSLPLIKMVVKASSLGVVIPNGMPKVVSYSTPTMEAADTASIDVKIKNVATEADSFDVTITGKREINTQPSRIALNAGEEKTITMKVQGAGIVGNYTIKAVSVNNPNNFDTMQVRILIDPFCDKSAEAGKLKVSTEVGCYYLCANEYQYDMREKTCEKFGTFEPIGPYITWENCMTGLGPAHCNKDYPAEMHCTGVGTYTSLNNYMDAVIDQRIQPFLPSAIPNAYWLPAPVCKYVGEYGYTYANGAATPVIEQEYGASNSLQANIAGSSTPITVSANLSQPITQINAPQNYTAPEVVNINGSSSTNPIDVVTKLTTKQSSIVPYIVAFGIVAVIAIVFIASRRKTGKKLF